MAFAVRSTRALRSYYRPTPEPGAGANVDPLGEGLIALFPDGFKPLFAPAAALPAPVLGMPFDPVVVPLMDDPVVVPVVAGAPIVELAPAVPLCASASVLVSVSAAASPRLASFMGDPSCCGEEGQTAAP